MWFMEILFLKTIFRCAITLACINMYTPGAGFVHAYHHTCMQLITTLATCLTLLLSFGNLGYHDSKHMFASPFNDQHCLCAAPSCTMNAKVILNRILSYQAAQPSGPCSKSPMSRISLTRLKYHFQKDFEHLRHAGFLLNYGSS